MVWKGTGHIFLLTTATREDLGSLICGETEASS